MKRLFIVEPNYSERYNATLSVTTREGNSIQKVIESIRKDYGVINEELLLFEDTIDTWEKFYAPIPEQLILTGKSWLKEFSLGHEWIFTPDIKNKIDRLKTALQFSPVGVSVLAWAYEVNGNEKIYTKEKGETDNHWVVCYGYEENRFWRIFDTYDNTRKKLEWSYDFGYAKRFVLNRIPQPVPPLSPIEKLSLIASILKQMVIIYQKIIELQRQLNDKIGGFLRGIFRKKS